MWEYFLWSFKLFISVLNYLFQSPINYFLFLFFLIRFLSFTFYPFFLEIFFWFFHLILFLFLLLFLITMHIIRSYYLFWFSFHFKLNQIFIQFFDSLLLFISFALCSLYISTPFVYFLIWLVLILCWSLLICIYILFLWLRSLFFIFVIPRLVVLSCVYFRDFLGCMLRFSCLKNL